MTIHAKCNSIGCLPKCNHVGLWKVKMYTKSYV